MAALSFKALAIVYGPMFHQAEKSRWTQTAEPKGPWRTGFFALRNCHIFEPTKHHVTNGSDEINMRKYDDP
ncbi:hypothetical protein FHS20_004013 [Phyllobacterium endophyticum]|nr:hypothetical protein [Phyllobacterium endophyticum]